MSGQGYRAWLRAVAQPSTYLGVAMIALIWLSVGFHISTELDAAQRATIQNSGNLARAFEEHLKTSIQEVDKLLIQIRNDYERDPANFDLKTWATKEEFANGPAFQASIAGPDGILRRTSMGPLTARIDISQRDHFQFHARGSDDSLSISQPAVGKTSGKWSVHVARRIRNPDGSFGGIVGLSLDPYYFVRFYDSLDLGLQGYVAIVGLDGVARAVGGAMDMIGKPILAQSERDLYRSSSFGWYLSESAWGDHVQRLVSYRKVSNLPLIIQVGVSRSAMVSHINLKKASYNLFAGLITMLIIAAILFSVNDKRMLARARDALQSRNMWFKAALDNIDQGLCMFDSKQRVVVSNRRYAEIYRLKPEQISVGISLREILEHRARDGNFIGPSPEEYTRNHLDKASEIQAIGGDRTVLIRRQAMADGGWVTTHEDITEKQRYDEQMAYLAHHDPLTGAANRVLLQKRIDDALAHGAQHQEEFAILLIDLDHFKSVNDTHGHAIGDQLLRVVSERLRAATRKGDTLARIGGDEFAILLTQVDGIAMAQAAAMRIQAAFAEPCVFGAVTIAQTLSIGITLAVGGRGDAETLFRNADLALYQAKAAGRNGYRVFNSAPDATGARVLQDRVATSFSALDGDRASPGRAA